MTDWGGGGGGGVMSRRQSFVKRPCPYILTDQLCLDLVLHERIHLPHQIQSLKTVVGINISWLPLCFRDKYERKGRKRLSVWQKDN